MTNLNSKNYVSELKLFFERMPLDLVYMNYYDDFETFKTKVNLVRSYLKSTLAEIENISEKDFNNLQIFIGKSVGAPYPNDLNISVAEKITEVTENITHVDFTKK